MSETQPNTVGNLIRSVGRIVIVVGVVVGLLIFAIIASNGANGYGGGIFVGGGLIAGVLTFLGFGIIGLTWLGFSEIIRLLQEISNKTGK